jgi:MFS family permease
VTTFGISATVSPRRGTAAPANSGKGNMASLLKTPGVARALATSATVLAVVDLTMVYLPVLGSERGLTAATVGALLAVRAVFSMVSRILLGHVSRKLGRKRLLVASLVLSTIALAAMAVPMPVLLLFVVMAVLGLGLGIGQPLTMSWLSAQAPAGQRGRALALRLAGNRVGQVVLPSVIGVAAAGVGAMGVFLASAAAVGGTLLLLRGVRLD